MAKHLDALNTGLSLDDILCRPCVEMQSGGFDPSKGIFLCQNKIRSKSQMEDTLVHEMIHAYDHSKFAVDWNNLFHRSCSEIRAASLSGECGWWKEFKKGAIGTFRKHHQECVKRRSALSVSKHPACKDMEHAKQNEGKDSCTVASESYQIEVHVASMIRSAEELLLVSRLIKEAWILRETDTWSSTPEQVSNMSMPSLDQISVLLEQCCCSQNLGNEETDRVTSGLLVTRSTGQMNVVLMGRKTWESLPAHSRPLKNRINVVISRQEVLDLGGGAYHARSLDDALALLSQIYDSTSKIQLNRVFVIGGGELYKAAMEHSRLNRIIATVIHNEVDCDVFFPIDFRSSQSCLPWRKQDHSVLEAWVGSKVPQ
ncbi:unnamed protein product, partial [Pneumocystis jirovecii]